MISVPCAPPSSEGSLQRFKERVVSVILCGTEPPRGMVPKRAKTTPPTGIAGTVGTAEAAWARVVRSPGGGEVEFDWVEGGERLEMWSPEDLIDATVSKEGLPAHVSKLTDKARRSLDLWLHVTWPSAPVDAGRCDWS